MYLSSEHYFWFKISEKYYFWDYEDLWIFFFLGGGGGGRGGGGHYEIGLFFSFFGGGVSFLYIIGRFKVKIQNGNIFGVANFQIFLGIPDIPDLFF